MGRYDPDNRSSVDTAEDIIEQGPETGGAGAGSLMSVEIRRSRLARKRAVSAPASGPTAPTPAAERDAPAGETLEQASPQVTPPAPDAAPGHTKSTQETRRPEEITAYWSRLRGSRPYPSASDLDSDRIAADWPNSVLFRCRSGSQALEPDTTYRPQHSGGPTTLGLEPEPGLIDLSPMMLQWLLSLAGDAVRHRRPVEDTESFPSAHRSIGYRAIALPLSENRSVIDHVLCHVRQA
jgi:hypothetical protein